MELRLLRIVKQKNSIIGLLLLNGKFIMYTLEDEIRTEKIYGKTAIPSGVYEVKILWSNKRGRFVPWILNVPNFSSIQMHIGNTEAETEGCILLGRDYNNFGLIESKKAFDLLMNNLPSHAAISQITICIENHFII